MLGIRKGTGLFIAAIMVASCGDADWFSLPDLDVPDEALSGISADALSLADVNPAAGEIGCRSATTLGALATCLRDTMPISGSEGYRAPSSTALGDIRTAVSRMLNGNCNFVLGGSIASVMELRPFTDAENGKTYCVLLEKGDANGDGYLDRGWGTFIVDPAASRELSHQAPHPLADLDTELQAIELFKRTESRSFLMCGAHRNANAGQACDSSYRKADCAHDTGSLFFAAAREISAFYGARPHHQIQWHGMASDSCEGVTAYISPGLAGAPPADSPARTLDSEAERANPLWRVTMPGSGTCGLNATDNVEGRHLNGISVESACSTEPTTTNGKFLHVEQKREARDPSLWVTPVTRAFPIPSPTPPTSLAASAQPGRINLTWVASNGASRYEVRRSTTSGGPYAVVATVNATSWADTNVVTRQQYFYVVAAANSLGTSAPSNQAVVRAR
ncbi:fibronectin type III domain-containing protein [Polyangium sp. 6x1]|uniref:fibronectin type III domain-containing protein n=1 Tax=Polyangium sp. 6x1 TaxID=3042689 RepID=UPI0024824784|nr:fibronectin type III domain-containing protein [Polyangium sp. 6x1]MDI1452176.1 fibronectin type III domain-containing protein [Polyangium sp. 6x1]